MKSKNVWQKLLVGNEGIRQTTNKPSGFCPVAIPSILTKFLKNIFEVSMVLRIIMSLVISVILQYKELIFMYALELIFVCFNNEWPN